MEEAEEEEDTEDMVEIMAAHMEENHKDGKDSKGDGTSKAADGGKVGSRSNPGDNRKVEEHKADGASLEHNSGLMPKVVDATNLYYPINVISSQIL